MARKFRVSPMRMMSCSSGEMLVLTLINFMLILNHSSQTLAKKAPNVQTTSPPHLISQIRSNQETASQSHNIDYQPLVELARDEVKGKKLINNGKPAGIVNKTTTHRRARFSSSSSLLDDESGDDHRNHLAESFGSDSEIENYPQVSARVVAPKEGVSIMRRAARNVERKMEALSGRVEQIEAAIAEDHAPTNQSSAAIGNNLTDSNSLDFNGGSTSPSSLVNNNIESPTVTGSEPKWSAPVPSGADDDGITISSSNRKSNLSAEKTSPSVIQSVFSNPVPRQATNSAFELRDDEYSQNRRSSDNEDSTDAADANRQDSEEQPQASSLRNSDRQFNLDNSENNSDTQRVSAASNYSLKYQNNNNNNYDNPQSSRVNEWNSDQNYQLIADMIKNNPSSSQSKQRQSTHHHHQGAVAFRPMSNQRLTDTNRQQQQSGNETYDNRNSEPNNYSMQHQSNPNDYFTPLASTTSTTTSTTSTTTRRPAERRNHPNSVHTIKVGNYGKSSKEMHAMRATSMPAQTTTTYPMDSPPAEPSNDQNSYSNSNNDSSRYHFASNDNSPVFWPAFASSSSNSQPQQGQPISNDFSTAVGNPSLATQYINRFYNSKAPMQQPQSMLTQESVLQESKVPNDDESQAMDSYQRQQSQQQQNINRQLDVTDMNGSSEDYQKMPGSGIADNDLVQESNTESSFDRTRFYQPSSMQPASYQMSMNNQAQQEQLLSNYQQQQRSRLQHMAEIVARNPSLSNIDLNSLIKYQQQQRLLANQLKQQQQQAVEASALSPSISRSYYASPAVSGQEDQSTVHSVSKRFSPEMYANYFAARSQQQQQQQQQQQPQNQQYVMSDNGDAIQLTASDMVPYTSGSSGNLASSQAAQTSPILPYQTIYSPQAAVKYNQAAADSISNSNSRALKAYYLQALANAVAASSSKSNPTMLFNQQGGFETSPPGAYLTSAAYAPSNNNHSAYVNSLYATAAMNSPAFYEAPTQKVDSSSLGGSATDSSQASAAQTSGQSSYQSTPYKRSVLNSLFKPTASSRYYYTPTILSPISLAAPTSVHSLYAAAPTAIATTADAMPSLYAANPYGQYLQHSSPMDQAAQYQAFAAATAANTLHPHYMDAEMAESSLVPSDSSSAGSPSSSSDDGGSSSSNGNMKSGSGKTGVVPWSSIMSLLMGVIPFGVIMALLSPALTVTGRKKRELEFANFGLGNFSDILSWRVPSKVLQALMMPDKAAGLANATAILNEQFASLSSFNEANVKHQNSRPSNKDRRSLMNNQDSGILKIFALNNDKSGSAPIGQLPNQAFYKMSLAGNDTQHSGNVFGSNSTANGVKAKVKKAINVLSNMINAAQNNIKRKHRSSTMMSENQSILPAFLKNLFKLENLFNLDELKRQLASVAHTRAILAQQLINQASLSNDTIRFQQARESSNSSSLRAITATKLSKDPATLVGSSTTKRPSQVANLMDTNKSLATTESSKDLETSASEYSQRHEPKATITTRPIFIREEPAAAKDSAQPEFATHTKQTVASMTKVSSNNELIDAAEQSNHDLEVCLMGYLCRVAVKLNEKIKHGLISQKTKNPLDRLTSEGTELEEDTKKYINLLVERIELKNPSVLRHLRHETGNNHRAKGTFNNLFKNAMENQCYKRYNCLEPLQLKKTLDRLDILNIMM